jgi:hypothetical protein
MGHFSRTIDADDTSVCARIMAVSREEADALFAIDAAGSERCDDGRFDDLLAKAVVHYLMSASGADVPGREIALAPEIPLAAWASVVDLDGELRNWIEARLGEMKPSSAAARTIAATVFITSAPRSQSELPVAHLFNIAA